MAINFGEEGISAQVWGPQGKGRDSQGKAGEGERTKPSAPPSAAALFNYQMWV